MSRTEFILEGTNHDIKIEFPWEEGIFIRVILFDKSGNEIERWERPISQKVWRQYYMVIQLAKVKLEEILQ